MTEQIIVVGTGYVGLPLAIMLARVGYRVTGVDIEENIVKAINEGVLHIREEDLQEIMQEERVKRNLCAQTSPCPGDIFIIAVPTPLDDRKKVADLRSVIEAMESILPYLTKGNLLIIESTVPPLTCRELIIPMIEKRNLRVGEDILLAHCPERILPGDIFYEIVHNDRIIGGVNEASCQAARRLYSSFVVGELYETDDVTAELCKLMENTYRDVNIALANEFALVAEGLGIDIGRAIELANRHPRVQILQPGIGVGGHCIPIDPWFIKQVDPMHSRLIFTARMVNDEMPHKIAAKIRRALREIPQPRIVALGATYKPNTHDLRESPALKIISLLREDGYNVGLYDPLVEEYGYDSILDICRDADCLAILVEHDIIMQELAEKEAEIKSLMKNPLIMRFWKD